MIRKDYACCFTGHRAIAPEYRELLPQNLTFVIETLIREHHVCDFITGGARGFDTLAAQAVLALRNQYPHIRLILALPCKNQTRGWNTADNTAYEAILKQADGVHLLAEAYDPGCMMRRNRFMVEHSRHCVFFLLKPRSGTYQTVAYALKQGHTLHNILTP